MLAGRCSDCYRARRFFTISTVTCHRPVRPDAHQQARARAVEQRNGPVGDGNRALRSGMHTSIRSMVDACMLVWCVSCGAFSRSQRLMSHVIVNRRQTSNRQLFTNSSDLYAVRRVCSLSVATLMHAARYYVVLKFYL